MCDEFTYDAWLQLGQQVATARCPVANQALVVRPEEAHREEALSVAVPGEALGVEVQQPREAVAELATEHMATVHRSRHRE